MADYNFLLGTRLSQDQQAALLLVEQVCREAGLNLYLTGGAMRDLLAGQPVRLLEITTEGDPTGLAGALKEAGAERLSRPSGPGYLRFHLRGVRLRVGAAKASGGPATIVEDLRSRGLTLNSIGLSLNRGSRGLPLDPTNGIADIEARSIRMNHPYVFLEDPMVALRAVRLRTRMGFSLEERTATRLATAIEEHYLERASATSRGQEFEAIAYEPVPSLVLEALSREGLLEAGFGKAVRLGKMKTGALARLNTVVDTWEQLGVALDVGLLALPLMLGGLAPADQTRLTRLLPSRHLVEWNKVPTLARAFEKKIAGISGADWIKVQETVEATQAEAVAAATLEPQEAKAARKLRDFIAAAQRARQRLPIGVLRAAGLAPQSRQAEAIVRPIYLRLLAGESLSDAEVIEQTRQAVLAAFPPPVVAAPAEEPTPARERGSRRGGAGAASTRRTRAAAVAAKPEPVAAPATVVRTAKPPSRGPTKGRAGARRA